MPNPAIELRAVIRTTTIVTSLQTVAGLTEALLGCTAASAPGSYRQVVGASIRHSKHPGSKWTGLFAVLQSALSFSASKHFRQPLRALSPLSCPTNWNLRAILKGSSSKVSNWLPMLEPTPCLTSTKHLLRGPVLQFSHTVKVSSLDSSALPTALHPLQRLGMLLPLSSTTDLRLCGGAEKGKSVASPLSSWTCSLQSWSLSWKLGRGQVHSLFS